MLYCTLNTGRFILPPAISSPFILVYGYTSSSVLPCDTVLLFIAERGRGVFITYIARENDENYRTRRSTAYAGQPR